MWGCAVGPPQAAAQMATPHRNGVKKKESHNAYSDLGGVLIL